MNHVENPVNTLGDDLLTSLTTTREDMLMTCDYNTDNYCDNTELLSHLNVHNYNVNKVIDVL